MRVGHEGAGDGVNSVGHATNFIDLGDQIGRAVAIDKNEWRVVDRPGVHFRRPEGMLPLPEPDRDGSIELLRPYVNLSKPDFRLMIAWLTAALRPVGPYPVLVLCGEQASGKTTLALILASLIDPQVCPSFALPSSTHDLMATAANSWLLVYENISTIPGWFSDCVCQLAFGGGFAGELFTNDGRSTIYAQRPVILVGIDDFVKRPDLRDRCVFLKLAPIPRTSRRSERTFWPAFHADRPKILGGLFSAISGGLRELPSVDLKELPRMADFAEWGEAVGRALGWGTATLLNAYNDNRKEATEPILDESPLGPYLLAIAQNRMSWSGSPLDLYRLLSKAAGNQFGSRWPRTVNMFGSELRDRAQLRLNGLSIRFERNSKGRLIVLNPEASGTADDA